MNLYEYDYLDADEMKHIFSGRLVQKQKVRVWNEFANNDKVRERSDFTKVEK